MVHLAGVISTLVSRRINASGITGRDLLGCAVAAAVSASFNAPIAGALFALEIVLRHFAVHAFAPIVIASAAGTVINRLEFGGLTEFALPTVGDMSFYAELPAFLLLGLTCGVGYETTTRALSGDMILHEAVVFAVLKIIAVSITLGGRMGGGVFSPSLMLGALTGLAFGLIATGVFPTMSGATSLYALAGMGAVAAAVLGAPISTTLIVFELTGDWQTGLAVMVAVSMSTALASRLVHRSFFLTQMERRGIHLAAGPQAYLLGMFMVGRIMRRPDDLRAANEETCWDLIGEGTYIDGTATLEAAMPIFEQTGAAFIPVVTLKPESPPELLGALFHVDALKAYNRALAETAAEEHS